MGMRSVIDSLGHVFNPIYRSKRKKDVPKVLRVSKDGGLEGSDDPTMEQAKYSRKKGVENEMLAYNSRAQLTGEDSDEDDNHPKLDEIG